MPHPTDRSRAIALAYHIKARVHIDGDKSITAVVIGFLVRTQGSQYEVAWFSNGAHHTAWVDEFRLTPEQR